MADQIPLKVTGTVPNHKISEFDTGDTTGVSYGGTGATTITGARANLDVPSNADLTAVDSKTDGSVTVHSDVSDAGSGQIITAAERSLLNSALQPGTPPTLSFNAGTSILTINDGEGGTDSADLSALVDDTNLARIVSGVLNSSTGVVTFTRDDATTFTVDFSSLFPPTFFFSSVNTTPRGTQSDTLQTYSSDTITIPADGTYLIEFSFLASINTGGNDFIVEIELDGTSLPETQVQVEHKDSGGGGVTVQNITGGTFDSGTNQSVPYHVRALRTLTAGSIDLNVLMRNEVSGTEATIHSSTLTVERKL